MSPDNRDAGSASGMSNALKVAIVVALLAVVGGALWMKRNERQRNETPSPSSARLSGELTTHETRPLASVASVTTATASTPLPRLVDLGARKCIPCKKMAPILEEMRETFRGQLDVVFIDVWEDEGANGQYGIKLIPTQIFYDASGKELFRHEGFFSREDILAKWNELGISLREPTNPTAKAM
jgi:thioredoxin 1